ncbi:S9 family peptidase [Rhodococcus qingshengii]|uniref:S9 family peptidase n=1 Tax=Rhodococcus qingshengii TaxID=334542 RepID=A0A2A5J5W7_RHOSG|nr:S9 family peptidase [Rhodococcus qingshengii]MCE4165535.1 prolyl oligopeptidase family serine peptidase [Rhodococcus sp. Ni2]MYV28219.1 prolyl oligopeptidase family serine peptidase [Rhodococcus erythropolis]PCK24984.1 S9 family peptidase [Rhodococcus qingshengii]QEM26562.1 S9 family peptidase [Rhodococcus qingshengii]
MVTQIPELHAGTPFDELDDYIALARLSGLVLSPDGSLLICARAVLDDKSAEYVSSLWEIDPEGRRPARRLTWGSTSESGAAFAFDGDVLFTATRAVPGESDPQPALWRLPAAGGEAQLLISRPGGVSSVSAAKAAPTFVAQTSVMASAISLDQDDQVRSARKDKKVTAMLHTGYPVRHWDHDLGPDHPHLVVAETDSKESVELRDITPTAGAALRETSTTISDDGLFVVTTWTVGDASAARRSTLVRIDTVTGDRVTLVDEADADVYNPVLSPDGTKLAFIRETLTTPESAPRMTLQLYDFGSGAVTGVADGWDRWPTSLAWLPDGSGLVVTADDGGRGPIFTIDLWGQPVRLTADDAAYTDLRVAPDGESIYALRASYEAPPHVVRVDLRSGEITALRGPDTLPELPGTLTEITARAEDGSTVRSWLALPTGAAPHAPVPLLLWVHGGPLGSWNTWSWRWNPWLLVAKGYAVLLPDPALSTGYGQDFVQRGWGQWGKAPFTDLMAITDAAVAQPEIDPKRTGAMGGSFGGYMANWIAGHTNRFDAIVTHASLWALDQFGPTTDAAWYWQREMSPEMAVENSPHLYVADITTPMLVIHGDKDYRVPIGEGLRLWYELLAESGLPADDDGKTDHRFLYFPDENHWVLKPQHTKIWYEVVTAFLSEHVLGEDVALPEILG